MDKCQKKDAPSVEPSSPWLSFTETPLAKMACLKTASLAAGIMKDSDTELGTERITLKLNTDTTAGSRKESSKHTVVSARVVENGDLSFCKLITQTEAAVSID